MKLKTLELFAGIGAASKALTRLGIEHEIVDAVEIDKYAIKSFNAIHGTNFETQDITTWDKDIKVDLIVHGSPCQDFSVAGKQAGGDLGSGTRSSLMYETIRIVGKLRPKYVIWENVKNILSKSHKHNFDRYIKTLETLGYKNYYQVLNAKDYGIPQNRERVFTISILGDDNFIFPEKQELNLRLKDVLEEVVDEKYYIKKTLNLQIGKTKVHWDNSGKGYNSQQDRAYYQDGLCPALSCCNTNGDKSQVVLADREVKVMKVGNVNPSGKGMNGQVISEEGLARTVTVEKGEGQKVMVMYNNKEVELPAICASRGRNPENPSDRTPGNYVEQRIEVNTQGTSNTLTSVQKDNYVIEGNTIRIRKLTPKECFRLMGFDDEDFYSAKYGCKIDKETTNKITNNLLIKLKYDVTHKKTKMSNSQLYKQAGNSIVVNVLEDIFKNLFNLR